MERQILNYQTSLTPHLLKEVQAYTQRENVELLGGQGGLALYFLSQWVKTGQSRSLLQAQLCLKKALLGINKLYDETSFHAGPLGILWVNYLFEEQTNTKIIDEELVTKILCKYFETQLDKKLFENHVLDFIYGVTGWFVIYPYLPEEFQEQVLAHFVNKVKSKGDKFLEERGYLGFAHGLASILFIIKEYHVTELEDFYLKNISILEQAVTNGMLPRTVASKDFKRQDWCHGVVGAALLEKDNSQYLKTFFEQEIDSQSHGVCHGVGSRILVSKLTERVFKTDYKANLIIGNNLVWKDEVKFYFLESFMIAQMSIDLNIVSDLMWWRIVYPVNIE